MSQFPQQGRFLSCRLGAEQCDRHLTPLLLWIWMCGWIHLPLSIHCRFIRDFRIVYTRALFECFTLADLFETVHRRQFRLYCQMGASWRGGCWAQSTGQDFVGMVARPRWPTYHAGACSRLNSRPTAAVCPLVPGAFTFVRVIYQYEREFIHMMPVLFRC